MNSQNAMCNFALAKLKKKKQKQPKSNPSNLEITCHSSVPLTFFGKHIRVGSVSNVFTLFLWLCIPSAKAICNRFHKPHLVSKKHDIKMWTYNKHKALSDTQEPTGKAAKGIRAVSSQMSEMFRRTQELHYFPDLAPALLPPVTPYFSWLSSNTFSHERDVYTQTVFKTNVWIIDPKRPPTMQKYGTDTSSVIFFRRSSKYHKYYSNYTRI